MKISFLGAAQTVTGSMHLLEINSHKLLLDCGLFQGRRKEAYRRNRNFPFDCREIDAVILSHAHIDHSGNLPHLVKDGFSGPIYTTSATAHLGNIMLLDSGHIHEYDAEYLNKKRRKKGQEPIEPLYTQEDAARVAPLFESVNYREPFQPVPGVEAHLVDAGHILGSASVVLDLTEEGKTRQLWFSGDVGRPGLPLIKDPELPEKANYLIMECTYGDKIKRDPEEAFLEFREVVKETISRNGKVIVPSFAVGRTQELVYSLHKMMEAGDIPEIPIFVDSPLAIRASQIFRDHPECFDRETQEFIAQDKHQAALGFDKLNYTRSVEESKAINKVQGSAVIISASGMAEAGRILHHLKNNIEDSRNTVVIVSWQAPHTLGRRLADRQEKIRIFGKTYHRKARIATIGGFSAHAGQKLLVDYARATQSTLKKVFLVHGEPRGAVPLMKALNETGIEDVSYPERGEVYQTG
ncbi:MAG: MBL fold metallo-hydrolase [Anaerolineales bacterium]|nr:MBL fold metallo-hydrolase [Anaerolineales bacterium]